ncbi:MAG: AAA family ATPase [Thermoleophilia bacterium]
MRIARIEAIAYGAIGGRVVEPEPGLTVIHGPNESGKSSTMQLIRGVLFGFPALRGEGPRREPKGGGQRSGRVDIVADDGRRFRVERTHGSSVVITDEHGEPVGDAALMRALGITSVDLFDRVQTFDSRDLASMGLLDDPSVRAGVLASAVLGGGAGAEPVLSALQKRADALYKKQGENQPYAHALKAVTAARRALREAEKDAGAADRSADALAEAEARVARANEQLVAATQDLQRLDRLVQLRAALVEATAVDAQRPEATGVEEPSVEVVSEYRAILTDLPVAIDARRRATQHEADAAGERERAVRARERVGLAGTAPVPSIADESGLRAAAEAVREAEREATRLGDVARSAATQLPAPVEVAAPTPRRGLGAALIAVSLIAIGIGWFVGITATIIGGILGVAVGAAILGGLGAGSRPAGPQLHATAADQHQAAAAQAEAVAEQARAAWRASLVASGLAAELRVDQLDDVLATFGVIRTADDAAARSAALAQADTATADAIVARAIAALGEGAPTELEQLRTAVDRALHDFDAQREIAATHRTDVQAWQHRRELAQAHVDDLSRGDAALVAAAEALDLEQAEAQRDVLDGQVDAARGEHTEAIAALGGTRALIENAEDSTDLAMLAQSAADAEADLRAVADEWLTLQLAHTIVEQARDRFVEEHQPGVFERAATQIATATNGSWVTVRMPDGEKAGARSEIVGRDGARTPFAELSEGTVGLVYLCLRAGLVDEMHDDGGPELPVLMDDVLTHLDPERRAGAAAVIADLATRHQVLYFTCHPEQVQALRDANPGLTEIELQRLV